MIEHTDGGLTPLRRAYGTVNGAEALAVAPFKEQVTVWVPVPGDVFAVVR
jgi:hypothetical protein